MALQRGPDDLTRLRGTGGAPDHRVVAVWTARSARPRRATPDLPADCGLLEEWVARFNAAGVRPGSGLALLAPNSLEAALMLMASWLLGVRYTPLHPKASIDDLAFVLEDAEIETLVFDPTVFGRQALDLKARTSVTRLIALDDLPTFLLHAQVGPPTWLRAARAPPVSVLAYTGGTTGRRRGLCFRRAPSRPVS